MSVLGLGTRQNIPIPIMTKEVEYDFIRDDTPLSVKQKKYCRCLLRVEAKGKVRSPYGICTASVGHQVRSCSQYYDWSVMNLEIMIAYLTLHKILVPINPTRELALKAIQDWKLSIDKSI